MPKYVEPMPEGLLRQRRNVIIASCVILFFHFGNITITSLTYSDIDFKVDGKNTVYIAIWLFYIYAVLRFYVYFLEDGWMPFKYSLVKIFDESCSEKLLKSFNKLNEKEITCDDIHVSFSQKEIEVKGIRFKVTGEFTSDEERLLFANLIAGCYISSPEPIHPTFDEIIKFISKTK